MSTHELISVFTATFNRAHLLNRLFKSLQLQNYKNFEWIIVDDGRTDTTEHVVKALTKQATFNIVYKKQKNQGKHIAINTGVKLANGMYFYSVDSDDRLPKMALEIISKKLQKVKNDEQIAGVIGLKCLFDKTPVGYNFIDKEVICDLFDYRFKYNVKGDRAEIIKTKIMQKYLFPKFNNEKFLAESIVWNRIAKDFKILFFKENVYECEYLPDGLSARSVALRRANPKGAMQLYIELASIKKIGFKNRLKAYINFWRFFLCDMALWHKNINRIQKQYASILLLPIGVLFYLKDTANLK